jgi:hypothetical protein
VDTAAIFQEKKQLFNLYVKQIWGVGLLLGAGGSAILYFMTDLASWIPPLLFIIFLVVNLTTIYLMKRIYKCPACGEVPKGTGPNGGINMNPDICRKCGASLE